MRNGLPETFDEFLKASNVATCDNCGDTVQCRFLEDSVCVGCRHAPAAAGGVDADA
ncbi:integrin alpha beta-propellor repeat protein (plasmid) [Natrialba magadii ATCC 43099]|uniref:Integrin alpha beta-propellor repeat protein n=1 Tax=Natrialba magadii (strain ATCC 43099 / DSM 3394 / CCM 3739 / CIP 104546 / IAM 13178 / JCM 8861 / NBRC 102185 / NCIMB 2190 / MS3) TaxID=547559 RepID=D3T2C8_NATMM|nr:hypothetical protein [Natrialba magadii]ADD07737.1 integrin alpha beta-propellor repeat protein [Natrialba magadii ATCC 43099]ELY22984.1 integrin alpha beta-propellor repeat protein [Natrialba magadii ATCC 43099]